MTVAELKAKYTHVSFRGGDIIEPLQQLDRAVMLQQRNTDTEWFNRKMAGRRYWKELLLCELSNEHVDRAHLIPPGVNNLHAAEI